MKVKSNLWPVVIVTWLALLSLRVMATETIPSPNAVKEIQDCPDCPTMIMVRGGTFWMGEDNPESIAYPRHQVTVPDFAIGKFEVTQKQWTWLIGKEPSWKIKACGPDCPISFVNWNQATKFAEQLSEMTGHRYRLPTEAEWEYACRSGGKNETYCGGEDLDELAWYRGRNPQADVILMPVGLNKPNGLGIYDMSGNVAEWISGWYAKYEEVVDAEALKNNKFVDRILRGGSILSFTKCCRSTERGGAMGLTQSKGFGFRLARDLD